MMPNLPLDKLDLDLSQELSLHYHMMGYPRRPLEHSEW